MAESTEAKPTTTPAAAPAAESKPQGRGPQGQGGRNQGGRRDGGRDGRRGDRNRDGAMGEEKQFEEYVVSIDRVSRVVKGGRRFRFRALLVVGDGKGKVGVGVSKGADVQAAVSKAVDVAKKNIITVPIYRETLPHEVTGKVAGANIFLKQAAPGTGLIAGGVVRVIVEAAGIKNILSKSLGSSNKVNLAYATIEALQQLTPASQWVTNAGKKPAAKKSAKPAAAKAEAKEQA